MKHYAKLLLLAGTAVTMAACAECPKTTNDYSKPPYVREGTAGEGVAVYNSSCAVEEKAPVAETRYEPAPAPIPEPKKAERVFTESQHK